MRSAASLRDSAGATKASWVLVRLVLGLAQMVGAVTALIFLAQTGLSSWTLSATIVTGALTTISVLLFGSRLPHDV